MERKLRVPPMPDAKVSLEVTMPEKDLHTEILEALLVAKEWGRDICDTCEAHFCGRSMGECSVYGSSEPNSCPMIPQRKQLDAAIERLRKEAPS